MKQYGASYFDGQSAAEWEVTVRPAGDGLRIDAEDGEVLAFWPYGSIQVIDEVI